jgi:DNA-binding response OmpR family regulator
MARLLIIEDDEPLRAVLARALAQAGHVVLQAEEGREGCALLATCPCDLVITDLIMPGQEGIETIMQLRQRHPGLPVIAMSGGSHYANSYLAIAAQLGVRSTLSKPFTTAELFRAIDTALAAAPPAAAPSA